MDQELLVEDAIEDGRSFLAQLARDGFEVASALWVKTADEGLWQFYIGSNSAGRVPLADAFRAVYSSLQKSGVASLSFSDIKLVGADDPVVAEAVAIRDRRHVRRPIHFRGPSLGKMPIDEAYIYPDAAGPMDADEVVERVADLMKPRADRSPSIVTLRDGSRFRAVPLGMRRNAVATEIYFDDVDSNTERPVLATDVSSIQ